MSTQRFSRHKKLVRKSAVVPVLVAGILFMRFKDSIIRAHYNWKRDSMVSQMSSGQRFSAMWEQQARELNANKAGVASILVGATKVESFEMVRGFR